MRTEAEVTQIAVCVASAKKISSVNVPASAWRTPGRRGCAGRTGERRRSIQRFHEVGRHSSCRLHLRCLRDDVGCQFRNVGQHAADCFIRASAGVLIDPQLVGAMGHHVLLALLSEAARQESADKSAKFELSVRTVGRLMVDVLASSVLSCTHSALAAESSPGIHDCNKLLVSPVESSTKRRPVSPKWLREGLDCNKSNFCDNPPPKCLQCHSIYSNAWSTRWLVCGEALEAER